LDWFHPNGVVKPFGDALVKLEKGSYTTTPVQTNYGWHVIKLEDTRNTEPPSLESVKTEIQNDLQRQQVEKVVSDLRAKAKIVNNTEPNPAK